MVASDSNVYTLDTDQRYPTWTLIKNTVNVAPLAVTPFYTSDGVLQIAALMSDSRVFLINPTTGTWTADGAVHVASQSVTDFKVSQMYVLHMVLLCQSLTCALQLRWYSSSR